MRAPCLTRLVDDGPELACRRRRWQAADMNLVRSSPAAAVDIPKARTGARLGVASRLLLAFLGISGLAVISAGVAIFILPRDRRGPRPHHLAAGSRRARLADQVRTRHQSQDGQGARPKVMLSPEMARMMKQVDVIQCTKRSKALKRT
jgi:hypothetical protein